MKKILLSLLVLSCFFGCQKAENIEESHAEPPATLVEQEKSITPAGVIKGRLLDAESSEPAEGVWLHLEGYEGTDEEGNTTLRIFILEDGTFPRCSSDEDGYFSFNTIPPGEYIIKTGNEFGATGEPISSGEGQAKALIVIKLEENQGIDIGDVLIKIN